MAVIAPHSAQLQFSDTKNERIGPTRLAALPGNARTAKIQPMAGDDNTVWSVIRKAGKGAPNERARFAQLYEPVIRNFLGSRWRGTPLIQEMNDAVQEVFMECFREAGALSKARRTRPGGFRAFLFGVVRNVARRFEAQRTRNLASDVPPDFPDESDPTPLLLDREWANAILRDAGIVYREAARATGPEAFRRYELLKLRFEDEMPIREIARAWNADAERVHYDYRVARKEFVTALRAVLADCMSDASVDTLLDRILAAVP